MYIAATHNSSNTYILSTAEQFTRTKENDAFCKQKAKKISNSESKASFHKLGAVILYASNNREIIVYVQQSLQLRMLCLSNHHSLARPCDANNVWYHDE